MSPGANLPRRARGVSLVELAVVLVAIGLVTLVLVHFLQVTTQDRRDAAGRDLLQRADDALLAFAMMNSRLPCADSDGDGTENCAAGDTTQVGRLPYRTLGLPDASARLVRYGVLRRPDPSRRDADLALLRDRFAPMQVFGGGIATEMPLGNRNGLDLCWALRSAQEAPADASFLHVARPDAPSSMADHVAYAMALPAPGEPFSSHQAGNAPIFDSPRRRASAGYGDRVLAVGLDQLWTRMRCGDHLAAAAHAHFNAAASIAMTHAALRDYETQLEIALKLAEAHVQGSIAATVGGTAGVASAAGDVADTISEGLASKGIVSYRIALAAVSTAAAIAVAATAVALVVEAEISRQSASDAVRDVQPLIDSAAALEVAILEHAQAADAAGIY